MSVRIKKVWFALSIIISLAFAFAAFLNPEKFIPMSDFLATIIAILIGVSLAISAVLANPPKVDEAQQTTKEEGDRAQKILDDNYTAMLDGQKYLFWAYYISLMLAVCLKFVDVYFISDPTSDFHTTLYFKFIASVFAFVSCFSLFWSATLPTLLHQVNTHKMKF